MLVHDLTAAPSALPVAIALPSPEFGVDPDRIAHLAALGDDAVAFGESGTPGEGMCWRGVTVRVNRMLAIPLPPSTCVLEGSTFGGHRLLRTKGGNLAIVNADAQLVLLPEVDGHALSDGFATSPTRRAFTRADARAGLVLVEVDLATGEQTQRPLHLEAGDRLLSLDDGIAVCARDRHARDRASGRASVTGEARAPCVHPDPCRPDAARSQRILARRGWWCRDARHRRRAGQPRDRTLAG